jgi:hypothetical protein
MSANFQNKTRSRKKVEEEDENDVVIVEEVEGDVKVLYEGTQNHLHISSPNRTKNYDQYVFTMSYGSIIFTTDR